MDCSPPGSSVHGISQTRTLEWVAISFSRGSSQPRDWTQVFGLVGWFLTIWATREAKDNRNRSKNFLKGLPGKMAEWKNVHISCKSTQIAISYWTSIDRRMLQPTRKDNPCPKTKRRPQWDSRRGTITVKSNPIPTRWAAHLENSNTKVLPLLWRFLASHHVSQPGDPKKGLGISRDSDLESQWDLILGFPQD